MVLTGRGRSLPPRVGRSPLKL
ncbi:hypothetical protein EJ110_NYTH54531 [Nymphaea thermarum]|nr:hypothetical protein EJ110_NYTH54531 [Nymphaea thermarum]